jgi:hypothetical protein
MAFTTAELFAARGDEWNRPNYQHPAGRRGYKVRVHPDGTIERTLHDEIEGYEPVAASPRAAIRKREFVEPNPAPVRDLKADRLAANRKLALARSLKRIAAQPEVIRVR